jgi:NTP pyrophosphatase (non-canonical NTP hydrolase)
MSLSATQQRIAAFVTAHNIDAPVEVRLLDLTSELGELAKEALKSTAYGDVPFSPTAAWPDELGDVFFSLVCLANASGIELEAALDGALAKYERRFAERGEAGSGR